MTMSCADYEDLLARYALETLAPEEVRTARTHLAECADCRGTLTRLRALVGILENEDLTGG